MGYEALQELIPFYPVYAVLFAETGLTTSQISSLFVLWAVVGTVAEVPSGALADLMSRKRLLLASAVVYGGTFAVWVCLPGYAGFALGFVLWGLSGAVASGTYEAYVHDTLSRHGAARRYQRVIARARAAGLATNLVATLLAGPLLAAGGFVLVGWVSVAACLAQALLAATLPPDRRPPGTAPTTRAVASEYAAMLVAGLQEARGRVRVRHAVLVAAVVPGFLAFDEYFPLLATDLGSGTEVVPLLIAATVAAQALGALLAERLAPTHLAPLLTAAALLLAAGSLTLHPAGFALIAVGYGAMQAAVVLGETHLQAVIAGPARATVTSVAGVVGELFAIGVFAGIALGAVWLPLVALVCLLAAVALPVAAVSGRWLRADLR